VPGQGPGHWRGAGAGALARDRDAGQGRGAGARDRARSGLGLVGELAGGALPSIGIFQIPAAVCTRYAPDSSPCVIG
jgi:hypothetical protein